MNDTETSVGPKTALSSGEHPRNQCPPRPAPLRKRRPGRTSWLPAALAVVLGTGAAAQEAVLEEIIVTGSRISRPDFESASPIVSITQQSFQQTSSTTVDTVMSRLPQFVPDFGSTSNNPSNGGQGNLQLRGLGPRRTLVLMDGRRLVPANGTGIADVNIIPTSLVESVEITTGGASAVYGSDAVAGVVNFRMKPEFEGIEFDGSWAQTERGDGEEYSIGITAGSGFADGRGQVYGYVGYSDREALTYAKRDFSAYTLGYVGPGDGETGPGDAWIPLGSFTIEEGRPSGLRASREAFDALFESYGYPAGTVPYQNFFGVNQDGSLFTIGTFEPGSVANFRGQPDPVQFTDRAYTYNYAPWNYLQLPLERLWGFGRASYELGQGHDLFGQLLYADYSAEQALAPTPSGSLTIPAGNPYVSEDLALLLGSRGDPAADLRIGKRFSELGPRVSTSEYDVLQVTIGLDGPISDRWRYDAYLQYGENDQRQKQKGNALRSRIYDLTAAPDGGMSACGEFNILIIGGMSDDCVDYISAGGENRSGYEQFVAEISATGPVADLPAGELRMAAGLMYKRDEYSYRADPIASVILEDGQPDIIGFNASDDVEGSDYNTDIYVEALIPVLAGIPGAEKLEAVLGYRHSEYDSAGGADSWKAELLYQPVEPLRLRASYQQAVRAPSVFELFQPQLPIEYFSAAGLGVQDPCEATSPERAGPDAARVEALCLEQGVPAELLADFEDQDFLLEGVQGGNPDLDPEKADTLTLGFVLSSWSSDPLWSGMQFSVDWYRIEMEDAIEYVYAPTYIPLCFDARTNPNFSASNVWCGFFDRRADDGEIFDFTDILVNIEGYEVSGVDFQFDWRFDAGPGTVGLNALVSWLDSFEVVPPRGLPKEDETGLVGFDVAGFTTFSVGGARPEWKASTTLRYDWQSLSLAAGWRYIDGMKDRDLELNYRVPSYDYFDLYATYAFDEGFLDGLKLSGGVENLTDEDPPLLPSSVQANTDPSQYDVLGRRYYLRASYRF